MIGIFKNNLFINSLLLLPYAFILRIKSVLNPVAYQVGESDTLLVKTIFGWCDSPLLQNITAIFLVYFQAVYINRLVIKNKLAPEITLLPGMIYIILMSLMPDFTLLSPHLIGNTLILIVIGQLFKIYKIPRVADHVFNVGFWLGVTCLFVPNYFYLLIVCIFSVFILRSIKQKELIQLMGGAFTLFFIFLCILFLLDFAIWDEVMKMNFLPKLSIFTFRNMALYKMLAFIALAIFTVLNYSAYTMKKSIQAQKKVDVLFWFLLGSGVILFLVESIVAFNVLLMFIPLAIFLNVHLINIKNPLIRELIHVVFVGLVFAFSFGLL